MDEHQISAAAELHPENVCGFCWKQKWLVQLLDDEYSRHLMSVEVVCCQDHNEKQLNETHGTRTLLPSFIYICKQCCVEVK